MCRIPHERIAPTAGLWEAVERNPFAEHQSAAMRDSLVLAVCPNHLDASGCRNGEQCKMVHVCREWWRQNNSGAAHGASR
eukprot:gene7179-339_t